MKGIKCELFFIHPWVMKMIHDGKNTGLHSSRVVCVCLMMMMMVMMTMTLKLAI